MNDIGAALRRLARQEQFLDVVGRDEAVARFHRHLRLQPLGSETVPLAQALGRVLARPVVAEIDAPGFDRASVDGFAVRADDTIGASERSPKILALNPEILTPGMAPNLTVEPGTATLIATGGMAPRGADAVVMVEHTETVDGDGDSESGIPAIAVRRPAVSGQFIAFAGSDLARGETVLRAGQVLTSREIGMLAAVGAAAVEVWRRPLVAVVSTGDEIVAPGEPIRPGMVYDSNAAILAAAVTEAGGVAVPLGIGADEESVLQRLVADGLARCDIVLLSGGTSKGAGDLCYRAIAQFRRSRHRRARGRAEARQAAVPGGDRRQADRRAAGVSDLGDLHLSRVRGAGDPRLCRVAGRAGRARLRRPCRLRIASERGRTEYLMVSLVRGNDGALAAYPNAKGSGAVTAFSQADGFIAIPAQVESVPAGAAVEVQLIGHADLADLVVIGSHCVGLDVLIGRLQQQGIRVKALNVGSTGGLAAAKRGECDIAPIHLMDPQTGEYNRPFLTAALELIPGYRRLQGIVYRRGDPRFEGRTVEAAIDAALAAPDCLMVNRNAGSGTRILTDRLLAGTRPPGYWSQPKSHNAVAVAVAQGRADWGIAIDTVARQYGLAFIPAQDEHYDFVVPRARLDRPAVQHFLAVLDDRAVRAELSALGFRL